MASNKTTALTREQARQLLREYETAQTAATRAASEAYARTVDADIAAEAAELARKQEAAHETARTAVHRATVEALIEKRQINERLSAMGLGGSGVTSAMVSGAERRREAAIGDAQTARRRTVGELTARLLEAREQAAAKKAKHTADLERTLKNKIAEKKLTLDRAAQ